MSRYTNSVHAIILAAGKSTRFEAKKTKQLTPIAGRTLAGHIVHQLSRLDIPTTLVLGHQAEEVKKAIEDSFPEETFSIPERRDHVSQIDPRSPVCYSDSLSYVIQKDLNGTGGAVATAFSYAYIMQSDYILIVNGDMPLLTAGLLEDFIDNAFEQDSSLSFCVTERENPIGYGRIVEGVSGISIIEEQDCTPQQRFIKRVNAGLYLVSRVFLKWALKELSTSSATGEIYITDLVRIAQKKNKKISLYDISPEMAQGVNTVAQLSSAERILNKRIIKRWVERGVRIPAPDTTYIDATVYIHEGALLEPGVILRGNTTIRSGARIGAYSIIENSEVGYCGQVKPHSVIEESCVFDHATVGPFARLRDDAIIESGSVVGNFVEIKRSVIGEKSKVKHLSYIGDASLGDSVNIGAGTITCNYDGTRKHETIIGNNVSVGANSALVAPVVLHDKSSTGAGSVITKDVPADALAIARARQRNKLGWMARWRKRVKKRAARVKGKQAEL